MRAERAGVGERVSVARKAFVSTLVAVAVVVSALALWRLKVVIALLFLAVTISAAMRPGVEWLAARRVPRPIGLLLNYVLLLGLVALFLSLVVPHLITQVESAISSTKGHHATGIKGQILTAIQRRLRHLPSAGKLVHPALSIGKTAFEVLIGIFFTFASAAYWLFERDRAIDLVASLVERPRRKKLRDTWLLIDLKLGAFVRGELILIVLVATVASLAFWAVGEPYFLLIGIAAGILEIVPVIGPLVAIALAAGAGLTSSWRIALYAAIALLAIRLLEDYLVTPRVLGGAVGLSPLVVLISVTTTGILLGGFYVLIAVPLASLLATLIDVAVRGHDPSEAETPTVLFPAKDSDT